MPEANNWNDKTITEFRANGGRVGGNFEGAPVALVHHRGRKSGREYVNPVMYLPDDADNEAIYVFATKGGAPSNPDWYRNLTAAGQGTVERGRETYPVTVRELQGDERDRIYDEQARRYPGFADYAKRTAGIRTIPVLELNRSSRRSLNTPDEESEMTYDNEAIVRHAYHTAEGSVLDVAGFVGSFANDGVINLRQAGIEPSGVGQESYRGAQLGELVLRIAKLFPMSIVSYTASTCLATRSPSSCRFRAPSSGRWRPLPASSSRRERRSTDHAPTSGTYATERSRCSTATSCSTPCAPKWA